MYWNSSPLNTRFTEYLSRTLIIRCLRCLLFCSFMQNTLCSIMMIMMMAIIKYRTSQARAASPEQLRSHQISFTQINRLEDLEVSSSDGQLKRNYHKECFKFNCDTCQILFKLLEHQACCPSSSIFNSNYVRRIYIRNLVVNGDAQVEHRQLMSWKRRILVL